jgi:hypothetical protein
MDRNSNNFFPNQEQIKEKITITLSYYIKELKTLLAKHKQLKSNLTELRNKQGEAQEIKQEIERSAQQQNYIETELTKVNQELKENLELNFRERENFELEKKQLLQERTEIKKEHDKLIEKYKIEIEQLKNEKRILDIRMEEQSKDLSNFYSQVKNLTLTNVKHLEDIKKLNDEILIMTRSKNIDEDVQKKLEKMTSELENKNKELEDRNRTISEITIQLNKLNSDNEQLNSDFEQFELFINQELDKFRSNADELFRQFYEDDDDEAGTSGTAQMQNIGKENTGPLLSSSARINTDRLSSARASASASARANTGSQELVPFIESNEQEVVPFNPQNPQTEAQTGKINFSQELEHLLEREREAVLTEANQGYQLTSQPQPQVQETDSATSSDNQLALEAGPLISNEQSVRSSKEYQQPVPPNGELNKNLKQLNIIRTNLAAKAQQAAAARSSPPAARSSGAAARSSGAAARSSGAAARSSGAAAPASLVSDVAQSVESATSDTDDVAEKAAQAQAQAQPRSSAPALKGRYSLPSTKQERYSLPLTRAEKAKKYNFEEIKTEIRRERERERERETKQAVQNSLSNIINKVTTNFSQQQPQRIVDSDITGSETSPEQKIQQAARRLSQEKQTPIPPAAQIENNVDSTTSEIGQAAAAQEVANTTETSNSLELESAQQPEPLTLTDSQRKEYNSLKTVIDRLLQLNPSNKIEQNAKEKIILIKNMFDKLENMFDKLENTNIIEQLQNIDNEAKKICSNKNLSHKNLEYPIKELCLIRKLLKPFMKSFN